MNDILSRIGLVLIFFVGGAMQYVGLFSATLTNLLALTVFCLSGALLQLKRDFISTIFLIFVAGILILTLSSYKFMPTMVYLYYVFNLLVASVVGLHFGRKIRIGSHRELISSIMAVFWTVQAIVTTIQTLFTGSFVAAAAVPIGEVDAVFGTLFLQSDSTLGAIGVFSLIYLHANGYSLPRLFVILGGMTLVFININSSASKFLLLFVICSLVLHKIYISAKGVKTAFWTISSLLFVLLIFFADFSALQSAIFDDFVIDYSKIEGGREAARFAPLGYLLAEPLYITGLGPLSYYNPITKEWLFNSGFGVYYNLYFDYGIISIMLYLAFLFVYVYFRGIPHFYSALIVFVVFVFSFFNLSFVDTGFFFVFGFLIASLGESADGKKMGGV